MEQVMTKKRCLHQNINIREYCNAWSDHDREKDGTWTHDHEYGDYSGKISVNCRECGLFKEYGSKKPKWVTKRMAEIGL